MTQPTKTKKLKHAPLEVKKIFKNETSINLPNTSNNNNSDIEMAQLNTDRKNQTKQQPEDDKK